MATADVPGEAPGRRQCADAPRAALRAALATPGELSTRMNARKARPCSATAIAPSTIEGRAASADRARAADRVARV
jgi:hypothetical protein